MIALLLHLLPQAAPPTVGDTIWLTRTVVVPAGAEVRPAPWEPAAPVGLLGSPVVRRSGDTVTVAYPAVAWAAGRHTVQVPGPVVIRPDGRTDSLPPAPAAFEVASVLPGGARVDSLPVQPEAGIVEQRITSPWPPLAALGVAAVLFAPVAWWWRRRGPVMPAARPAPDPVALPLAEWGEDGEHRAVAAVAALELRRALLRQLPGIPAGVVTSRLVRIVAEQRPGWPIEEIATVLRALEAAEYAEAPGAAVVELAGRAARLVAQVEGA